MDLTNWEELQRRLDDARTALEASERHELEISHVMRIVATFGPRLDTLAFARGELKQYSPEATKGWQRRAWNAILCAEKVLPLWLEAAPFQTNVQEVLREARQVVKSGIPPTRDTFFWLEPSSDDVGCFNSATGAYLIGELAIGTAHYDIPNNIDIKFAYQDADEIGDDPLDAPNVVYAIRVYTGDWDHDYNDVEVGERVVWRGDDKLRWAFWLWWLNEAVPASWQLRDV